MTTMVLYNRETMCQSMKNIKYNLYNYIIYNYILYMAQVEPMTNVIYRCRKYKGVYPNFTPEINTLSSVSSKAGKYKVVHITGTNFLPNGTTYINFGEFADIQVNYLCSFKISFVIPINALPGVYDIVAVNIYNDCFSPQINVSYPGSLTYSNSVPYTLTQ